MTLSPEAYTEALFERSDEAVETAMQNLQAGHHSAAVNRAYYAAFYAARAVLNHLGEAPATHKGVKTRFFDLFVKSGRLEKSVASILTVAEEARQSADYDVFSVFEASSVNDLIVDIRKFVAACRSLADPAESR